MRERLCPACGYRAQHPDSPNGWCRKCDDEQKDTSKRDD